MKKIAKFTIFVFAISFSMSIFLKPTTGKANCSGLIVDTWDSYWGTCHGEPKDCLDECIIKPNN